ncbi:MAG TPA: hypothetical protein VFY74_03575 [Methyloceanibacter sp.]|nr:hypothetical protein [Methyloceanibacter sp.]
MTAGSSAASVSTVLKRMRKTSAATGATSVASASGGAKLDRIKSPGKRSAATCRVELGKAIFRTSAPKRTKNAISPFSPVSASACPRRGRKTVA